MSDDRILNLVDEVIETGRTPEEVCADCPECLSEVRLGLEAYLRLENRLNDFFPEPAGDSDDTKTSMGGASVALPGYEIVSVLGRGGMGTVFLARHERLERLVAVKLLRSGPHASAAERDRFQREATSLASMRHPNIVRVYDVGDADGYSYFTMEYMPGGTLAQRSRAGLSPHGEAARTIRTLADAVEHAHSCGIIHRDLKPANILLDADGTLMVSDFGIARSSHADRTFTVEGARMGTPNYMPPEQVRGRTDQVGPASDVYALGAILYELLTGRPPFIGESQVETERQVIEDDPVPPSRLNPRTPKDLETICLACLRKSPADRYATAAALRDDLHRFLTNKPIVARPVGTVERAAKWARRHPTRMTIACSLGIGAILLVAASLWMQRIERAQQAALIAREERARQLVESAISHVSDLRVQRRWSEAIRVMDDARIHVSDAHSPGLEGQLAQEVEDLALAQELDMVRRGFPKPGENGLHYEPGLLAYEDIFNRLGIGYDVPAEEAAERVRQSAVRDELVIALDNAAFATHVKLHAEMAHLLQVSRLAAPDPWGDRFRLPETWRSAPILVELAREGLAASPPPPPHQMLILGVLLWELGETGHATETLRTIQRRFPTDYWVNLELAHALRLSERNDDAAQYYRAAVVIQPDNAAAWAFLGIALRRAGQTEESSLACRRAVELDPEFRLAWNHLIYQLAALDRFDDSAAALEQAIAANPSHAESFDEVRGSTALLRARYHAARCEWTQATSSYETSLASHPWSSSDPWFEYAAVSILAERPDLYESVRQKAVGNVADGGVRAYIAARACTLAAMPHELVTQVSTLCSTELAEWHTRHWSLAEQGAILVRQGRAQESIALFEQSLAAEPRAGSAVVGWAWLALAHAKLGNRDQSRVWRARARTYLDGFGGHVPVDAERQALHLHNWLEAWAILRELDGLDR